MKNVAVLIAIAAVLSLFFIGLKYGQHHKRHRERHHTYHLTLKPRKKGSNFRFKANDIDASIIQMVETLQSHGGRLTHQIKHVAIVYLGEFSSSKFNEMMLIPVEKMPIRVMITTNAHDDTLLVRIDEDYGFQLFTGKAKTKFIKKYKETFEFYHGLMNKSLV